MCSAGWWPCYSTCVPARLPCVLPTVALAIVLITQLQLDLGRSLAGALQSEQYHSKR